MRCDGLVVATPAGSTGYNLANGGPVLAWGVEGFVVSFIAPHSLTARALVVAPGRPAHRPQPLRGAPSTSRSTGARRRAAARRARSPRGFCARPADLAQLPGSSFYRRLREKFGRLASTCNVAAGASGPSGALVHPSAMLRELRVENLLLIERAELRLAPG